jgi:hypothetical protein
VWLVAAAAWLDAVSIFYGYWSPRNGVLLMLSVSLESRFPRRYLLRQIAIAALRSACTVRDLLSEPFRGPIAASRKTDAAAWAYGADRFYSINLLIGKVFLATRPFQVGRANRRRPGIP